MQGIVLNIGAHAPMFDQTPSHYIAVISDEEEDDVLVAFPKLNSRGQGTAWVTGEKQIIFGSPTPSVASRVTLKGGSRFPVLSENERVYRVLAMRYGRVVSVEIPRSSLGLETEDYVPPPPVETNHVIQIVDRSQPGEQAASAVTVTGSTVAAVTQKLAIRPSDPPPATSPPAAPIHAAASQSARPPALVSTAPAATPRGEPGAAPHAPPVGPTLIASATPPALAEAAATADSVAAAADLAASPPPSAVASSRDQSAPASDVLVASAASIGPPPSPEPIVVPPLVDREEPSFLQYIHFGALGIKILLFTVIMEGALVAGMSIASRRRSRTTSSLLDISSIGVSITQDATNKVVHKPSTDLSGTLDSFSMGQVVQFFCAAGESGILTISNSDAKETDTLVFNRGQIIDAKTGDGQIGQEAASLVLRRQHGSFTFKRQDVSTHAKMIEQDTMSLLLEAHRVIDEQGWSN
jgi:hypothetical protein